MSSHTHARVAEGDEDTCIDSPVDVPNAGPLSETGNYSINALSSAREISRMWAHHPRQTTTVITDRRALDIRRLTRGRLACAPNFFRKCRPRSPRENPRGTRRELVRVSTEVNWTLVSAIVSPVCNCDACTKVGSISGIGLRAID
jgi:hypothetical protein